MNTAVQLSRRSALSLIAGALVSIGAGTSARAQGRGQGNGGNNGGGSGNGNAGGSGGGNGGNSGNGGNNGNGNPGGNANSNAGGKSAYTGSAAASGNPPSASASSTASIDVPDDPVEQEHDLAMQAVEEGRVLPMRNLMVQIETKFRAEVIDAKLRPGRDGLIYELKMLSEQGRIFVVSVNAATGLP